MGDAPFHSLPGDPASSARCFWLRADDGLRIRAGHWPAREAAGTVLLFPGRTEYVEKYNELALELNAAGYHVLTLDWRGQGLSDRLIADPRPGHVHAFRDYQRDVVELLVTAGEMSLPRPWHLLAHSMGGAIGLAAMQDGMPVSSAAFSAPMWGLGLSRATIALARVVTTIARHLGHAERAAPRSGGYEPLVLKRTFHENLLTSDGTRFGRMIAEAAAWPELAIGGVTNHWLAEALAECRRLAPLPAPDVPTLVGLGSDERIVSAEAIRQRVERWPEARLMLLPGARHEPLMERDRIRTPFVQAIIAHFAGATRQG